MVHTWMRGWVRMRAPGGFPTPSINPSETQTPKLLIASATPGEAGLALESSSGSPSCTLLCSPPLPREPCWSRAFPRSPPVPGFRVP